MIALMIDSDNLAWNEQENSTKHDLWRRRRIKQSSVDHNTTQHNT